MFSAICRWLGTVVCLALILAFFLSAKRCVMWDSPGWRYEASLMLGAVWFGWRPEGWRLEDDMYPGEPGWSIAEYGGSPRPIWWIDRSSPSA